MKDHLYRHPHKEIQPFRFGEETAEVFEDMILRSVPEYQEVLQTTCMICSRLLSNDQTVCDLGCSTGTTLLRLQQILPHLNLKLIGFDYSSAMLQKAFEKAQQARVTLEFYLADICQIELPQASAFFLHYTLQFIPLSQRLPLLQKIYQQLTPQGFLILSEKICFKNSQLGQLFNERYIDFKRQQGYSDLEISQKQKALEHVLQPLSFQENLDLLSKAGFQHIEPLAQKLQFLSLLCFRSSPSSPPPSPLKPLSTNHEL